MEAIHYCINFSVFHFHEKERNDINVIQAYNRNFLETTQRSLRSVQSSPAFILPVSVGLFTRIRAESEDPRQ